MKIVFLLLVATCATVKGDPIQKNRCTEPGFFPLVENSTLFYGCYLNEDGDLTIKYLSCSEGYVFNSDAGECISVNKDIPDLQPIEDDSTAEIENPTLPPTTTESDIQSPTIPTSPSVPTGDVDNTTEGSETDEPVTVEPVTDEPVTDEPVTDEPVTDEPVTDEPVTDEPVTDEPVTDEPVTDEPVTDEPITDEPVTDEPVTDEPVTDEPVTDEPVTDEPVTDEPVTDEPVTDEPVTDDPGTGENCLFEGFFPEDLSCNKFIYCGMYNGVLTAFHLRCSEGLQFNSDTRVCEADYEC